VLCRQELVVTDLTLLGGFMPVYQVRTKFSAIRTWEVEAKSQKEAEEKGHALTIQYWLSKAVFGRRGSGDKIRTLSVHEVSASNQESLGDN